ncbi:polyhydroxyalkanoate depolymerase [Variibacter gotjawalensis]|nr:polyhydroxyalkanoate depolymerase [Variibacter gotjawalensis]NIK48207.1 poly(3-hydroxybutyrate) depolymerase [Variibacter gotjawalensis]
MKTFPLYQLYEMQHAALSPFRAVADASKLLFQNPVNPFSHTLWGKSVAATAEMFERVTRRYGKPEWGLDDTEIDGDRVAIHTRTVWQRAFCGLTHFARVTEKPLQDPRVLIVAPMSGHYATLLRGTVEALLPRHEVYITDWVDARSVPLDEGDFDLDSYIDYIIEMLHHLGPDTHLVAVCQPSVPVLAGVAIMEARGDKFAPRSMTLMGGPIDTRSNPTAVNKLAQEKGIEWFRENVITHVPFPHAGMMRPVYPGFLQLSGFMSMNLDRHVGAHRDMFGHLVRGDGESAQKHREFYDEYLSVMDLTAEFYLQTVDTVFCKHALPKGEMMYRDEKVDPSKIRNVALLTVEGELDDISGVGQTEAAHRLCSNLPPSKKQHHLQPAVGHYGVFNGSRFRKEIVPRIEAFVRAHGGAPKKSRSASGNGERTPKTSDAAIVSHTKDETKTATTH